MLSRVINIIRYQGYSVKKKSIKYKNHIKTCQMQGGHERRIKAIQQLFSSSAYIKSTIKNKIESRGCIVQKCCSNLEQSSKLQKRIQELRARIILKYTDPEEHHGKH